MLRVAVCLAVAAASAAAGAGAGAVAGAGAAAAAAAPALAAHSLRADGLPQRPGGAPSYVASAAPRLSWQLALAAGLPASARAAQAAYRVVASRSREGVPSGVYDAWDSGWVVSNETLNVRYGGAGLDRVGDSIFWSVLVRDAAGAEAPAPAAAPLVRAPGTGAGDWAGAIWIAANATLQGSDCACYAAAENTAPALRAAFTVPARASVAAAHLFFVGLGLAEAFVSGSRVGAGDGGGGGGGGGAAVPPGASGLAAAPGEPGARAGDEVLSPPWSSFGREALYSAHDVTRLLAAGGAAGSAQALGLFLGRGWWDPVPMRLFSQFNLREHLTIGRPQALALLLLRLADGSEERLVTSVNGGWAWAPTGLTRNNVYLGETHDLRQDAALVGWTEPAFNASAWAPVVAADAYRAGAVRLNPQPPVRVGAVYAPESITPRGADYIVAFPRNMAAFLSVGNVSGPRGAAVSFTFAEILAPDGDVDTATNAAGLIGQWNSTEWGACAPVPAVEVDELILAGGGGGGYTNKFSWHAFRYVRVRGWPTATSGPPRFAQLAALAVHVDNGPRNAFSSSDPRHNAINELAAASFTSNWAGGIQSDCPGRERLGYGGDMLVSSEAATLTFDTAAFYAKRVVDHADAQGPTGNIPETAPFVGIDTCVAEGGGNMQWGAALSEVTALLLSYAGDAALAARILPAAAAYAEYLYARLSINGTLVNGLADGYFTAAEGGCTGAASVVGIFGTAYYARQCAILSALYARAGEPGAAARWAARAADAGAAFRAAYFDDATGVVGLRAGGSAGAPVAPPSRADAQAWALRSGVLGSPGAAPGAARAAAVLAASIDANGTFLGAFATSALWSAGHEWTPPGGDAARGLADVAYRALASDALPSYGYMLANNATALWEHWTTGADYSSRNHAWYGSVSTWLRRVEGGVGPAPGSFGFDRILIRPVPPRLTAASRAAAANVSYASARGPVAVRWTLAGRAPTRMAVALEVPANVMVTIELPLNAPVEGGGAAGGAFAACGWAPPAQLDAAAGVARWQLDGYTGCDFTAEWAGE